MNTCCVLGISLTQRLKFIFEKNKQNDKMQDKLHWPTLCKGLQSPIPSLIIYLNRQSNTVQLYIQGCSNSDLTYKRCANKIQHYQLSLEPSLLDTAFKQRVFVRKKWIPNIFSGRIIWYSVQFQRCRQPQDFTTLSPEVDRKL